MSNEPSDAYDLKSVHLPYLSGPALRLFAAVMEGPLGDLLTASLFKTAGISWLREQRIDDPPTMRPIHPAAGAPAGATAAVAPEQWPQTPATRAPGFRFASVHDYAKAYRDGEATPTDVAQRVLAAIDPHRDHALRYPGEPDRIARHLFSRGLQWGRAAGWHAGHGPCLARTYVAPPGPGCRECRHAQSAAVAL